ncbi:MAG: tRNA pseudouridine(55) synthase TruB [Proteobacteria bacterium]|nr:tRNA pseudouridine(55) synthase TruB [Pseudomonadota bacterium]
MAQRPKRKLHGWLAVDKPLGMTSTQALGKVRWLTGAEKSGHGGTLDPLATGLLPIALGEATKTVNWAMDGRKTYHFTVQWGAESTTDDREGELVSKRIDLFDFSENNILPRSMDYAAMQQLLQQNVAPFHGAVQQRPPAYSAIKVDGDRAYDLARSGAAVELAARTVEIEGLTVLDWPSPSQTTFEVRCGKGTYVRSLARDLGRATGWHGHVIMLRRLSVGPFAEADMISLEKLEQLCHQPASENSLGAFLRPIETVLDGIPALAVMDRDAHRLRQGQTVLIRGAQAPAAAEVVLVQHDGTPLGLCSIVQGALKPRRLFNL